MDEPRSAPTTDMSTTEGQSLTAPATASVSPSPSASSANTFTLLPDILNDEGAPVNFSNNDLGFVPKPLAREEFDFLNIPIMECGGNEDEYEYREELDDDCEEKEEKEGITDDDEPDYDIDVIMIEAESFTIYCGRLLGTDTIPGSDGRCGPRHGPNCPSCRRLEQDPLVRRQMLKRVFPQLNSCAEESIISILRKNYGNLLNAVNYLQGSLTGIPEYLKKAPFQAVKLSHALSELPTEITPPQYAAPVLDQLQTLQQMLQVTFEEAEYALRHQEYNMERAADFLLNDIDTIRNALQEETRANETRMGCARRKNEQRKKEILDAIEKCATAKLPEMQKFPFLSTDCDDSLPPMISDKGHRMIHPEEGTQHFCVICTSTVPSKTGGRYFCQACKICEGCIQTSFKDEFWTNGPASIVWSCPAMPNGGHLHRHPIKFVQRKDCYCDMDDVRPKVGCPRYPALWTCEPCNQDFCAHCIAKPAPERFDRRLCQIIPETKLQEEEVRTEKPDELREFFSSMGVLLDSDDDFAEHGLGIDPPLPPPRQMGHQTSLTAEREAAGVWQGTCPRITTREPVLGTGDVGRIERPVAPPQRGPSRDIVRQPHTRIAPAEGLLNDDERTALQNYQAQSPIIAASDITHAEDILRRAHAADNRFTNRAVRDAVADGRLAIAGTLLLSQAYAPVVPQNFQEDHASDEVWCWCGDPIDAKSSPDGAVGCLGGHAMHPSCAADLLLGGGHCPTCRQPLFYSRLAGPEVKAAAKFAKEEILRVQEEEKQRLQKETEELSGVKKKVRFSVGDIVLVTPDIDSCRKEQMVDPITGGWWDDMSNACGLEGLVEAVVLDSDDEQISVKVRSAGPHSYTRIGSGEMFTCQMCSLNIRDEKRHKCRNCSYCDSCCLRTLGSCPHSTSDWHWNPSLLTLLRRQGALSLSHETVFDNEASAKIGRAERHILRLKSELVAVKKAREDVRKEADNYILRFGVQNVSRGLSSGSSAAVFDMAGSGVSPADWQRARHLLLLAQQWGNSKVAKEKRAALYDSVRSGDLDSVARLVRKYNVELVEDDLKWADAIQETAEYVVAPFARVQLRAFPCFTSPRTGYSLSPSREFTSSREIFDEDNGVVWIQISPPSPKDLSALDGAEVRPESAYVGARVRRSGPLATRESGEITRIIDLSTVLVRWDKINSLQDYSIDNSNSPLIFDGSAAPPSQGWLCTRPGGNRSREIVSRKDTKLRCFGCGDKFFPNHHEHSQYKYESVKGRKVEKGDVLLVAATLDGVVVESTMSGFILCLFPSVPSGMESVSRQDCGVWYRPEDLVLPNPEDSRFGEEIVSIKGREYTRRELFLKLGGDVSQTKRIWNDARQSGNMKEAGNTGRSYASCAKGHLLHARCLQGALVSGQSCPAPGCREPLWVPAVTRTRPEGDTCCAGTSPNARAEADALQAASELPGHDAIEAVREADGRTGDFSGAGLSGLKMCPLCCSGPLFNNECSDMAAHHGQCSVSALRNDGSQCTDRGNFRVAASEIAARVAQVSSSQAVTDVLPKCETHNALVIFNGCLCCGHLFTDTRWTSLPDWDPKAKALMVVDKKTRNAARLLTGQVRTEAALLQFERDALFEAKEGSGRGAVNSVLGWGGSRMDTALEPPPLPPPPTLPESDSEESEGDY